MLLTYPFGDALNTSLSVSAADAELFIPITCRENAGMTTPIHTIVWLTLGNTTAANAEFNRWAVGCRVHRQRSRICLFAGVVVVSSDEPHICFLHLDVIP